MYVVSMKLLDSMVLQFESVNDIFVFFEVCIPWDVSALLDLGPFSMDGVLFGSLGLARSAGGILRSGLFVLDVTVSLVVT
jgi:hypothetical protein